MAKLTLNDITAGYGSNDLLNDNFTAIEEAIENTLSLDGTIPNSMSADLDMNGNAILNARATNGNENFIWRGDWASSTVYSVNNLVYVPLSESATNGGSTYICTTAHTASGSFDSDIANWHLLALQGEDGAPGAGTGDVVGPTGATANNIATYDGTTGKLIKDSGFAVVDEDDMASDSAVKVPSQQSVKAYADTKASEGPAFFVSLSSNQTLNDSTNTRINFDIEDKDTDDDFDNVTNYRFTPSKAGYYIFTAGVYITGTDILLGYVAIRKNGTIIAYNKENDSGGSATLYLTTSTLVYMNGTTDYVDVAVYANMTGSGAITNNTPTFFSGSYIRSL